MFLKIKNEHIDNLSIKQIAGNEANIFVFAIGYEERSIYLFKKFKSNDCIKLGFLFNDYKKYNTALKNKESVNENCKKGVCNIQIVEYSDYNKVIKIVKNYIIKTKKKFKKINIHFDYSSMPRSWYCRFLISTFPLITSNDKVIYWYSQGRYTKQPDKWPSAGIENVRVFCGNPSLRPINNRSHILGLGFDNIRSQAIYSVLDPNYLVVTYSHPQDNNDMRKRILNLNKELINSSAYSVTLPIDDFDFSISKLLETVKELSVKGDVILVPDGPKPQILVSSILPWIIDEPGIICFHVNRHESFYEPVNVRPTGKVFGVSFQKKPYKQI